MTAYNFSQLIDFTRTSSATYVDNTGKIVSTPASRNLLLFTQEFDNSNWVKTNATVTANSTTAPDGTGTADKLAETATTANHLTAQSGTASAAAGVTYTVSVSVKAAERGFCFVGISGSAFGTAPFVSVNLSTGAITTANGSPVSSSVTSQGDGWYRVTVTGTTSTTGSADADIRLSTDGVWANRSYAGTAGSGIFIWGAQLEQASAATAYTRNFSGLFPPRFDYDPVTLAPKGLLIEEQRTNLVTYSEQFDNAAWTATNATITANAAVAPSGATTADAMLEDTANSVHAIYEYFAIAASTTYTSTVYVKRGAGTRNFYTQINLSGGTTGAGFAWFDLGTGVATAPATIAGTFIGVSASMTAVGNGWYRCSLTFTSNTGNNFISLYHAIYNGGRVYTGDGTSGVFIWGAQLEAGAFATSYIPTVASQVTRTVDVAAIRAPNFAPWYNQSEGTFVVEADSVVPTTYTGVGCVASVNNSTDTSFVRVLQYLGRWGGNAQDASVVQANLLQTASYAVNTPAKSAFAYRVNDFAFGASGATPITDTSGTVPTVERMSIGAGTTAGGAPLNGHIRSIRYYPSRLTNAQLQALTA